MRLLAQLDERATANAAVMNVYDLRNTFLDEQHQLLLVANLKTFCQVVAERNG